MNHLSLRKLAGALVGALFLGVSGYAVYSFYYNTGRVHDVVLEESGFVPSSLIVAPGDTVRFRTSRTEPFWPASNLHPSHTIYPAFDPGFAVRAGESWQFRFDEPGFWQYHDHLAPRYEGVIAVAGPGEIQSFRNSQCDVNSSSADCLAPLLEGTFRSYGMDAAFGLLVSLLEARTSFAATCHGLAHELGESAYALYAKNEPFQLSQRTSLCGYGFYHGFMEALLYDSGDMAQARDFCAYVGEQLRDESRAAEYSCYHGIGHGVVDETEYHGGSVDSFIQGGLAVCERVGDTEFRKNLCASGVFNSLAIAYRNNASGFSADPGDPYAICREQEQPYFRAPCYMEMNTYVLHLGGGDLKDAAVHIFRISDKEYARFAVEGLAGYAAATYQSPEGYSAVYDVCRAFPREIRSACIHGFVGGLLEFGSPRTFREGAGTFCTMLSSDPEDEKVCYESFAGFAWGQYNPQDFRAVCDLIREQYEDVCTSRASWEE